MLPMDYLVTGAVWLVVLASIVVSVMLSGKESRHSTTYRWVLGVGFAMVGSVWTLRLIVQHDILMSPPFAVGMLLVCAGYVGLAIDRVRS